VYTRTPFSSHGGNVARCIGSRSWETRAKAARTKYTPLPTLLTLRVRHAASAQRVSATSTAKSAAHVITHTARLSASTFTDLARSLAQ